MSRRIRSSIGRAKAAVLPVPVSANPITSRPVRQAGIVSVWIGRGESKPMARMPRSRVSWSPNRAKAFGAVDLDLDIKK